MKLLRGIQSLVDWGFTGCGGDMSKNESFMLGVEVGRTTSSGSKTGFENVVTGRLRLSRSWSSCSSSSSSSVMFIKLRCWCS